LSGTFKVSLHSGATKVKGRSAEFFIMDELNDIYLEEMDLDISHELNQ